MDAMPANSLSDLLACVTAFGRSLDEAFDPQRFLAEFSARVQRLVPHDRVIIVRREEDGHACSVFAAYAVRGTLIGNPSHYTTAFSRGDRLAVAELLLTEVFEGDAEVVADMAGESRFQQHPFGMKIIEAGLRARLSVPFSAGGRLTGAFVVASATAGLYTEAHAAVCRQIADLIGPFVETVVVLHRERRRRERLQTVTALPPLLGASLKVGDVLERLGEAVRPLIDFDLMGLRLRDAAGEGFERIGSIRVRDATGAFERTSGPGASQPAHPEMATIDDYSVSDRLSRGEAVLIHDVERELDRSRSGDRRLIKGGGRSVLAVPLLFGEEVGGCLFFGDQRVHWYDETDVEIAAAIASQMVLAVQHQRLAEEQRRAAGAEEQARKLQQRVATLRAALGDQYGFDRILGRSAALRDALARAEKVAPTEATVLITGESGTGKELVARAIHYSSLRADGPFEALNCAALPETLLDSELFGHEKGAFTGADRQKRGRFELAGGGTLFLDEVGELSPTVQAKLLRVLQEREFQRVGGTMTLKADVRILAATNKQLEQEVAAGRFREDLLYRLNVFPIPLPALRQRGEDVLLLAEEFVRELAPKLGKAHAGISQEAKDALLAHPWPGNIRELQNAIERALILSDDGLLTAAQLGLATPIPPPRPAMSPATAAGAGDPRTPDVHALADLEKQMIVAALREAGGNKSRAAAALGLSRTRFYTRLRHLGLAD